VTNGQIVAFVFPALMVCGVALTVWIVKKVWLDRPALERDKGAT
jgi:hypothetical protein